jgi:carbon storage regulator
MLVLGRRPGERIVIPHCDLEITVVAIDGNRVRLGIAAPTGLAVYRQEVWRQLCRQTHGSPGEESGPLEVSGITDPRRQ